jgi:hypothetical protein
MILKKSTKSKWEWERKKKTAERKRNGNLYGTRVWGWSYLPSVLSCPAWDAKFIYFASMFRIINSKKIVPLFSHRIFPPQLGNINRRISDVNVSAIEPFRDRRSRWIESLRCFNRTKVVKKMCSYSTCNDHQIWNMTGPLPKITPHWYTN